MVFGTDGVRGIVDSEINYGLAYDIGKGMALYLNKKNLNNKVVIGSDTRPSSDIYVSAVAGGLADYGINVEIVGIVSTPMISFLVSRFDYSGGIMITASHNDSRYNGIKVFNEFGEKMNKKSEREIESNIYLTNFKAKEKGKIVYNESITKNYIDYLLDSIECDLTGLTVALDCANGSNYKIAPYIYKKLGASVVPVACTNNGSNINNNCGANHINDFIEVVKKYNVDIGFAFDGDGDRLRVVLSDGKVLSGDDILLTFALFLKKKNKLKNLTVAGTIMTNLGMEKTLVNNGIKMLRSDVGDKNVIQLMKDNYLSVGGESSGHICLLDYIPSCDALYNSIFFINCCKKLGLEFNEILSSTIHMPNLTKNIEVDNLFRKNFDYNVQLKKEISKIQKDNKNAKIVVRPSGTEPVIRIYVESTSEILNKNILEKIEFLIKNKQG